MLFDADGACSWAASAMRCATRFMQVEMHHVEPHIAGTSDTQDGNSIGTVVVKLSTHLVYQRRNFHDFAVEESQFVRVSHHDGGDVGGVGVEQGLQVIHLDTARFGVGL